jgi:hypothetical protein
MGIKIASLTSGARKTGYPCVENGNCISVSHPV